MRTHGLLLLAAGLLLAADAPTKEAREEQAKFQGIWKVVSVETGGAKKRPHKDIANWVLIVADDHMTAKDGDDVMDESRFTLDPGLKTKAIDIEYVNGPDKGKSLRGIYRLEGEKLTFCVTQAKERPSEFATGEKAYVMLIVLQRQKK